jgi:hypothetical protein
MLLFPVLVTRAGNGLEKNDIKARTLNKKGQRILSKGSLLMF